ncbi:MAG: PepSY-like domain-containing protein [Bacteroides sp.]|nr:PepSY-like domain-containing protein [Bacteroides sp.]
MNKLKLSLLIGMLMSSLSVFADYAPANVQAALKKMYPTADDIAWSRDEEYYVADFMMNGFDTKVWFNADAEWVMKQTDWVTMDEVPPAVYNTFAASEFSGDRVQNVTWVQFPRWQAIVAVEVGRSNLQTKYQILFTPNGEILRARNVTYIYNPLGASTFL